MNRYEKLASLAHDNLARLINKEKELGLSKEAVSELEIIYDYMTPMFCHMMEHETDE